MKSCLISFVVALMLVAALPAMATDLEQQQSLCSQDGRELYGMTQMQETKDPAPKAYIWFEYRWVDDGCCDLPGGLRIKMVEQERMCHQYFGCGAWYNTGAYDCTNYPCGLLLF